MDIVPVVDLKAGQVVHARMGRRDEYRPIATPLCQGSALPDVVAGLLGVGAFRRLYVADLDAIEGRGNHDDALRRLAAARPGLELWVDRGTRSAADARAWLRANPGTLVLGSESLDDAQTLHALRDEPRIVLSLDYRAERFVGPQQVLDDPGPWPARVIAMTLARVGAAQGPDLARIAELAARLGGRQLYAAGGVRHADDLVSLHAAGAHGALVATALHTGALRGPVQSGPGSPEAPVNLWPEHPTNRQTE